MQDSRKKLLLVEDDPDDVWMIRSLLSDRWDAPFDLAHVELLSAAIQRCEDERFDLVLLDLSLPDSKGMETFFAMVARSGGAPIVILSNHGDEATAIKAVQAGAQDYLLKGEVNDRVLVRSLRYAIERNRRHLAEQSRRDTAEEFRVAQRIQQRLAPSKPPTLPGFDIAGALYPTKAAAGDYFDYIPMLDDCLGVVLGDVSGRGMSSALLMSETRACLRTLAQAQCDVGEILTRANRILAADTDDLRFVTLAMARIDPRAKSLAYAGAGQCGYVLRPGIDVTVLDSTSVPLGVRADTVVPAAAPIPLHTGDLFTFFTDGAIKVESPDHARFGVARALQTIRSEREKPAAGIIDALYGQMRAFCRDQPLQDDVSIVVVKVLEG